MGTTEVVCPHCGYDFPPSDYAENQGPSILGTLGKWLLRIAIFVPGLFVISIARFPWGVWLSAWQLVVGWAMMFAWAFLSYVFARAITWRLSDTLRHPREVSRGSQGEDGQPPEPG
ncbi:MAG: hypothetical protein ACYTFI_03040 [Planctomycetota bacterium]|jgi:hypothetical protein